MFFTKTLKRIKTIVFTVTGIGQVTVTSVKYEKEYVTRCQKKGYGDHHGGGDHKGHGDGYHRRREDYDDTEYADPVDLPPQVADRLDSYDEVYSERQQSPQRSKRDVVLSPSIAEVPADVSTSRITNPLPVIIQKSNVITSEIS